MNALEKALLIKELNLLIDGLEHRSLSFFEIAKSKSRLTEIFGLCDEPIFKKQILKFKSHTQPEKQPMISLPIPYINCLFVAYFYRTLF